VTSSGVIGRAASSLAASASASARAAQRQIEITTTTIASHTVGIRMTSAVMVDGRGRAHRAHA